MPKRKFVEVYPGAGPKMMIPAKKMRAVRRMEARQFPASSRWLNRRGVASKETGYVDLTNQTLNVDTTGTIVLMATIAQGASVNQRVGKKVQLKSAQIRGRIVANASSTVNDCALLLVYDRRPTGSLPAITDILVSADSNSLNNDANSGRFQILRRIDTALVGAAATAATDSCFKTVEDYINLRKLPAVFKAAGTGAIGDIEQGALYLVAVGQNAAGATAATALLSVRTRFLDV